MGALLDGESAGSHLHGEGHTGGVAAVLAVGFGGELKNVKTFQCQVCDCMDEAKQDEVLKNIPAVDYERMNRLSRAASRWASPSDRAATLTMEG